MKSKLLLLTCLLFSFYLKAQNVDYKANAENLSKTIWENPKNGFELKTIPDDLKKESAVILSKSYQSEVVSNKKFKYLIITATVVNQTNLISTYHERTLLNDKAALDDYASLSYQKKLDNTIDLGLAKAFDESNTYIGVKIVKPNGKEVIVNTSEEVLLKNKNSDQKGKLAIPDLQVGDIIDYYISYVQKTELSQSLKDLWILNSEYYTLNYSFDFTYSDKYFVKYSTVNNCPDFVVTTDNDGNSNYHLEGKNLPRRDDKWWVSTYRTYPYFEIDPFYANKTTKANAKKLTKNDAEKLFNTALSVFRANIPYRLDVVEAQEAYDYAKMSYKKYKDFQTASYDSILSKMHERWRYVRLFSLTGNNTKISVSDMYSAFAYSTILEKKKIPHEIILVSSRYWKKLEDVYDYDDIIFLIKVNGDKPSYIYFNNIYNLYNELPSAVQGETAYSVYQYKDEKDFKSKTFPVNLPIIDHTKSVLNDELEVSILTDMQKIKIKRKVTETGSFKTSDQKALLDRKLILETLNKEEKTSYDNQIRNLSKPERIKAESHYNDEIKEQQQYFTDLVKEQYEIAPEKLTDQKIVHTGLLSSDSSLVFTSTFELKDFIQKAGANYLLNAGKLIGTVSAVKTEEKTRDMDIYMPAARTLSYQINVNIPEGYNVKGIDKLNKTLENECGSFNSKATLNGKVLTLVVNRIYFHNFEKAKDWPKLISLIDAAYDYSIQKILLEKI